MVFLFRVLKLFQEGWGDDRRITVLFGIVVLLFFLFLKIILINKVKIKRKEQILNGFGTLLFFAL